MRMESNPAAEPPREEPESQEPTDREKLERVVLLMQEKLGGRNTLDDEAVLRQALAEAERERANMERWGVSPALSPRRSPGFRGESNSGDDRRAAA